MPSRSRVVVRPPWSLRLRCRAHNQLAAERVFGAEFMRMKRDQTRVARRNAAAQGAMAEREAAVQHAAACREQAKDLEAGLRGLGCRVDEARRAAAHAMAIEGATFEDRLGDQGGSQGRPGRLYP